MLRSNFLALGTILLASTVITLGLAGCGQPNEDAAPPIDGLEDPAPDEQDPDEHANGDQAQSDGEGNEIEVALAKLSPEDQELAEQQEICPVSGKPLGSMGTPIKVTVEDRDVLVCCDGCEDPVRERPEEYFAKIDQQEG